jgi:hypothetical protein
MMQFTNRSVHHQCDVERADKLKPIIEQILLEDLGDGSVITCQECGQHWAIWRGATKRADHHFYYWRGGNSTQKESISFERITKRHRMLLNFTANTKAYDWIMRMWGVYFL